MNHDITPELIKLFTKKAEGMGFSIRRENVEADPKILLTALKEQEEICRFEKGGAMRFWPDSPYVDERNGLHNLLLDLKERYDLYLDAKPLDCADVRDYRLISEFGNYLLAAKLSKDNEIRFTTWQYTYDRTGVTLGHYYETNYQGALKDFTLRSGLIDQKQIFTEDELLVLYKSCLFRDVNDDELDFDSERKLQDVIQKVESNLPHIPEEKENQQEQEDERGI
ncbi:hypothetical protein [Caproicibacter fermentans]|uniref:Large polyvalent protein-associated domain-containing protein n=1 Tax=Caproicibacter fermentans TaxID=2576756 RepID=A0A7G8TF07_9FIRM|nr:hypothetical protein [Caproicibacter fermentans]QNK42198.1 hypothetical protein HCR03_08310 [Caproicibacter fermentans]